MIAKTKLDTFFRITYLILLMILVFGIPLAFSSLTRSVFEVNKLLILRMVEIVAMVIWLFHAFLYQDNNIKPDAEKSISILGLRFKKTGLEWPMLAWVITNIISTIISQNVRISIIGAYDRWEGIITIINYVILVYLYAKLVTTRWQFFWIIGGTLVATALSGVYGVFQSLGIDFMNWSSDPTSRVFACINNPVHYCPYMAMVVPVGIAVILYITKHAEKIRYPRLMQFLILLAVSIIYYAQFLSYSRAAWLGFIAAMTTFYFFVTNHFLTRSKRAFIWDFALTNAGLGILYMITIFHYHQKGGKTATILLGGLAVFILMDLYFRVLQPLLNEKTNRLLLLKDYAARWVIIIIFAKLQFVAVSLTQLGIYILLVGALYFFTKHKNTEDKEVIAWLTGFALFFAFVISAPALPGKFNTLFHLRSGTKSELAGTLENVAQKVSSYEDIAIKGSARSSMWRSSIPWIKDNPLFGTGPDTTKYVYPQYRESEYGILEGGHNFTPDRLHNEYLTTLTTRGIIGFLIYYVGIIGAWFYFVLRGCYEHRNNPLSYIGAALAAGALIYLGQVMFNFGVVATLYLFFTYLGLGLALVNTPLFSDETNEQD